MDGKQEDERGGTFLSGIMISIRYGWNRPDFIHGMDAYPRARSPQGWRLAASAPPRVIPEGERSEAYPGPIDERGRGTETRAAS